MSGLLDLVEAYRVAREGDDRLFRRLLETSSQEDRDALHVLIVLDARDAGTPLPCDGDHG